MNTRPEAVRRNDLASSTRRAFGHAYVHTLVYVCTRTFVLGFCTSVRASVFDYTRFELDHTDSFS